MGCDLSWPKTPLVAWVFYLISVIPVFGSYGSGIPVFGFCRLLDKVVLVVFFGRLLSMYEVPGNVCIYLLVYVYLIYINK